MFMKRTVLFLLALVYSLSLTAYPGKVVKMLSTPGNFSTGLTFDGKYLWLADRQTDLLYQINPDNGKVVKTLPAPGYWVVGLAWDGKYLWAVDERNGIPKGDEYFNGKLYTIDPETGTVLRTVELPFKRPQDIAWDGHYFWTVDAATRKLIKFDPADGTTIKEFTAPSPYCTGLTFDGEYLWITDHIRNELYMVDPDNGNVLIITSTPDEFARGLAFDGKYLWLNDSQSDKIYKVVRKDNDKFIKTNERRALLTFNNDAMNYGPGKVKELDFFIAIPENRDNQQIIGQIEFEPKPTEILTDQWGQKVARFRYENIGPGQQVHAVMKVKAYMYDVNYFIWPDEVGTLKDIPESTKIFLQDGNKFDYNNPVIQRAVKEAIGEEQNVYWIVRKIFDYIRSQMYYERVGGWNTAPTVLERGNGSCSEYSFVFIAMCRAAGVPARYVGSIVERGEKASMDEVYHRWVEVYMPGYGWIPVDPSGGDRDLPADQARYFGHLSNRFLITTQGGGNSKYLEWTYNSNVRYVTEPKTFVTTEAYGDWQPIEK